MWNYTEKRVIAVFEYQSLLDFSLHGGFYFGGSHQMGMARFVDG